MNSPTNFAGVEGSIDVSRPCDDTLDNDGDGYADYPNDPACARSRTGPASTPSARTASTTTAQPGTDFDGGVSVLGPGNVDPHGADPQCTAAYLDTEAAPPSGWGCGLGPELVPVLASLAWLARRRRRFAETTRS